MLEDLTLFQMAKKRMDWVSERQTVLAENIANANTPGYKSKDLKALTFKEQLTPSVGLTTTNPMHVSAPQANNAYQAQVVRKTFESSPDKNDVVLEEQAAKLGDAKGAYEMAASLFQKNVRLLKMAIGRGGA